MTETQQLIAELREHVGRYHSSYVDSLLAEAADALEALESRLRETEAARAYLLRIWPDEDDDSEFTRDEIGDLIDAVARTVSRDQRQNAPLLRKLQTMYRQPSQSGVETATGKVHPEDDGA